MAIEVVARRRQQPRTSLVSGPYSNAQRPAAVAGIGDHSLEPAEMLREAQLEAVAVISWPEQCLHASIGAGETWRGEKSRIQVTPPWKQHAARASCWRAVGPRAKAPLPQLVPRGTRPLLRNLRRSAWRSAISGASVPDREALKSRLPDRATSFRIGVCFCWLSPTNISAGFASWAGGVSGTSPVLGCDNCSSKPPSATTTSAANHRRRRHQVEFLQHLRRSSLGGR